jgi:Ankyrin repeat
LPPGTRRQDSAAVLTCRSPEPRTYAGISKISVPRRDTWEDERDLRLRLIGAFFRGSTPQFGNQLGLVGSIRAQFEHGSSVEAILGNHRCGRSDADPNSVRVDTKHGQTALPRAAVKGHARIVTILLHSGADTDLKDYRGRTPLRLAEGNRQREVAIILWDSSTARILELDGWFSSHSSLSMTSGHTVPRGFITKPVTAMLCITPRRL